MTQSALAPAGIAQQRPLGAGELGKIEAYWRAANYLSVGHPLHAARGRRQQGRAAGRQVGAAMLLVSRIGEQFDAMITGASEKGTWVRVFQPPVDGLLAQGFEGVKVGDLLRVQLVRADVEQGFIDFQRVRTGA